MSGARKKLETETPKIEPLAGFIEARYVKCGRSNCHCATGKGHGPYHYWVYKIGKRRHKKYIKKEDLAIISAQIETRRRQVREFLEIKRAADRRWKMLKTLIKEFNHQ